MHQATKTKVLEEKILEGSFPSHYQHILVQREAYLSHPSKDPGSNIKEKGIKFIKNGMSYHHLQEKEL